MSATYAPRSFANTGSVARLKPRRDGFAEGSFIDLTEDPRMSHGNGHDPEACGQWSVVGTLIWCECCQGLCAACKNLERDA